MEKKILVIDDEEILTKTFSRLLEKSGFKVLVASRGEDACAMAEEEDFDLVLSDIRMPGSNGIQIVKEIEKIRSKQGHVKIPVIFMTGFADEKLEAEARILGPVEYLSKPFDVSKVLDLIRSELTDK